jgi:hypothetical protein
MTIARIFDALVSSGGLSSSGLQGCSPDEIYSLEQHFGCHLPLEYAEFMRVAGCKAGKLFNGTDIFYPRVLGLKSEALELLDENRKKDLLPSDGIVFCMHQGYELNYMIPGAANPCVWQYIDGADQCVVGKQSFTDFVSEAIHAHLEEIGTCD